MAIALPVETNRWTADRVAERGATAPQIREQSAGSILIIGDDELLIRALDRLLRQAGYVVGTAGGEAEDVALTIVDTARSMTW